MWTPSRRFFFHLYARQVGGYVTGTVLLLAGAMAAIFGLDLLATCARDTQSRRTSYGVVAQASVPAATIVIDAAVAIKCFGMEVPDLVYEML